MSNYSLNWRKSINLDRPEESFVCMAGDFFSTVEISWSWAPPVLQLPRLARYSGDHPLWRGTPTATRPYGRPGSRWQTPPCQPCTVCKLEWCTARRSPAGTSPPAQKGQKKEKKKREIIAHSQNEHLSNQHNLLLKCMMVIYGWRFFIKTVCWSSN